MKKNSHALNLKRHFSLSVFIFTLFLTTQLASSSLYANASAKYPVDISLLIVDLKYNAEQGVKVCEIQPISYSLFTGSEFVRGYKGYVAERIYEVLSQYHDIGWVVKQDLSDEKIPFVLKQNGWKSINDHKKLMHSSELSSKGNTLVDNPYSISAYSGIVYSRFRSIQSYHQFKRKYPGLIPVDAASFLHTVTKFRMSKLFQNDPVLERFKPKWKQYSTRYVKNIADTVLRDIGSDIVVIKPTKEAKGDGVIIVHKNDLHSTLKMILKDGKKAKKHKDKAYKFWANNNDPYFIVEEFIPSDPVNISHLNDLPYDVTTRVAFALVYHEQNIEVVFLENFWKLPRKSLVEEGSLNEKYKTCLDLPYYSAVDPDVAIEIEKQLKEMLVPLYKKMLEINNTQSN